MNRDSVVGGEGYAPSVEPTPDAADQMRLLGDLEPDEIRDVNVEIVVLNL